MKLKNLIDSILTEDNRFNYLMNIVKIINKKDYTQEEIQKINRDIILSQKNKQDFFEEKTLSQFKKEVVYGSIELIEKGSSKKEKLKISKQHLIMKFLKDYTIQVLKYRKEGLIFFED